MTQAYIIYYVQNKSDIIETPVDIVVEHVEFVKNQRPVPNKKNENNNTVDKKKSRFNDKQIASAA